MTQETRVTKKLNIKHPIIQGPFGGGLSAIPLVSAVSNSGGLGSFGAHYMDNTEIENLVSSIRQHTKNPFAINLWVSDHDRDGLTLSKEAYDKVYDILEPYFIELKLSKPEYPERFGQKFDDQIMGILKSAPPSFSFVYGIPDSEILKECKKRNITTIGTATTVEEAVALDDAGVDLIVATGFEAGGHRVSFLKSSEESLIGGLSLIPQAADQVKAPIIAAGGIADGRAIKAAFALGAEAVQIGTAFLACIESNAPAVHKNILLSSAAKNTGLTRAFTGRLARGIKNRIFNEMEQHINNIAPYPAQAWITNQLKKAAIDQSRADLMSLWSGQSASLLKHKNAKELIESLLWAFEQ